MHAPPGAAVIAGDVRRALAEDVGSGDVTAALVAPGTRLAAQVTCRESAVLCGQPWFDQAFHQLDPQTTLDWQASDGDRLQPGQVVCRLEGDASALLTAERTALNFLQTLSGTATAAAACAGQVTGTGARVLDTRKTLPGLRLAQKYAVRCGGADNHRVGLFDAVLVKENHIAAAGSITAVVKLARERHPGLLVEVEVETLEQLREAMAAGAQRALLDNFDLAGLRACVALAGGAIELEASGNVTQDSLRDVAETGVDYVSLGAITKHLRAVDFSMRYVGKVISD